ncbi:MFS transporter [Actinophytocola algeriensis]|uniref:EmrB/QacA subfamily drug resistance transporter n=1 Tax=Actinophytocola algeriensis TaxID=1768010 RepID=A0A7W7Q327_9PSEU|nr:MFS transporter [Actinophytocola algeriensis]MBB4906039.1 EmrB/QacA subfamily drug resistance transporter [Actinophytocola algeriensis]MBE1472276.1 EmrB/QacA subfamily drug resistance transporter [Actinophytocola algeriensis]
MSHGHAVPAEVAAPPDSRRWTALVLLCLAQLMLIVDITVVQVALPTIGDELGLGREALTWVVTAYTLVFGGLMVFGGRLADTFGARRTLLAGLALFTVASLVCGLAASGGTLIAGRAVQGVGAALMSPSALSIITTSFHGAERNRALGVWAAIGGTGAALGVLVSGLLTAGPGWEWVFFVNVPIGILVAIAAPAVVRADPAREERQRVDVPGALVVTFATGLLIYGLVNAGDGGWGAVGTLVPVAAAVLGYGVFVVVESRVRAPLMRPATMARRPVVSGTFLMLVATGLLLGLFFLTSLYFQHVRGFSAWKTGLLFLPVAIAITVGAQLAAHLIGRIGGRPIAVASFLLTALGAVLLSGLSADGDVYTEVLPGFLLAALGIGPVFVTATTTTLANVPPDEAGVASGVVNTFHELGGSIGVAVVSTVAAAGIASTSDIAGFADAYLVCGITAGVAALVAIALVPGGRPRAVTGHGH